MVEAQGRCGGVGVEPVKRSLLAMGGIVQRIGAFALDDRRDALVEGTRRAPVSDLAACKQALAE